MNPTQKLPWTQVLQKGYLFLLHDWLIDLFIVLNATFSYIMATSFSGGRSRSTPERTTDHVQATGKLYHLRLWVECTLFCNLQSWVRTNAVLVVGLYELLGNPTTGT
jgi:hypothetical protein